MKKPRHEQLECSYYEFSEYSSTYGICYQEAAVTPKDYGTGENYTMLEVHTVTFIAENSGITITEIAKRYKRTTSSISQLISRLEKKELVIKKSQIEGNKKIKHLFVTDKGENLSKAHIAYDERQISKYLDILLEHFSMDEINGIKRYFEMFVKGNIGQSRQEPDSLEQV